MLKSLTLIVAVCMSFIQLNAQKIVGHVNDAQGSGLDNTTVALLKSQDSSLIKMYLTDDKGNYTIPVAEGNYLLQFSHVGYQPVFANKIAINGADKNIGTTILQKTDKSLDNVTITYKKPMVEVKADKLIVNVEGSINAVGNDGLELLRKSPGVMVDKDDNLSLAGKNGVRVYIDGKPSPLAGADLANYLKSIQSSQVEALEIITNPSAKYEAAGNAGIINIRLKKDKTIGTNGSINAGYTQGFYPKYNAGINLNHRNKSINVYGNYSYSHNKTRLNIVSRREQFDTLFLQDNLLIVDNKAHNYKTGIDFFVNKSTTIGAILNGTISDMSLNTSGPMEFIYMPTNTLTRILSATNNTDKNDNNINANLNYRYNKASGENLSIDFDYGNFNLKSNQFQPNYYFGPDGQTEQYRLIYKMVSPSKINLSSIKADYETKLGKGMMGLGFKIGQVNTDNDFQRYNVYTSQTVLDTAKSNLFTYKENINAVYVNYNIPLAKSISLQAGLRAENTNAKGISNGFVSNSGHWNKYDSIFKRNYTDLFPSVAISFTKDPKNQVTISYSRRIDRPVYQDLNPFEFKLNEYTFMKGNPYLQPQYTNSFTLTHIHNYRINMSLTYSHVKDIFAQIPDTIEKTKSFLIKRNLANQDIVSFNFGMPVQYKWYSSYFNVTANYQHYVADFGGGNRKVNQTVYALTAFMQNSFTLGNKGWKAELSGLYISPSVWQGLIRSKSMGNVELGIQKSLFRNQGNIKFVYSDIFKTMYWGGHVDFSGAKSKVTGRGEMPQFKLNFTWRFGSNTIKAATQRKTGIEDETKRAKGGGGQGGF